MPQPANEDRGASVRQSPAQRAAKPLHAARAAEGRNPVATVLTCTQH